MVKATLSIKRNVYAVTISKIELKAEISTLRIRSTPKKKVYSNSVVS